MKKERIFLITKKIDKNIVILGYVTSSNYPSTIVNDQDKAKEMFGYDYVTVTEISKRCFTKMISLK